MATPAGAPPASGAASAVGATGSTTGAVARRASTVRFTEATRAALQAHAEAHGLSVSEAAEQLIGEALAARMATLEGGAAAGALGAEIARHLDEGLREVRGQLREGLDQLTLEVAVGRLLTFALIGYEYGEAEARTAEEGALRLATRAVAKGQMATLPPGALR